MSNDPTEQTTREPLTGSLAESPDSPDEPLLRTVTSIVLRNAPDAESAGAYGPDTVLAENGFDSLRVVRLLVDLEDELGISFPSDRVTAATFHSTRTIADAVRELSAGPRS